MTADTSGNPNTSPAYRALRAVVIILGVLIVAALGALAVGAVLKLGGSTHATMPAAGLTGAIPSGARIISVEVSGNRAVVALRTADGDEIDIFDTDTGRPVARIRPAPK